MPEIAEVTIVTEQLDFYLAGRKLEDISNPTGKYNDIVSAMKPLLPLYYDRVFNKGKQIIFSFSTEKRGDSKYYLFLSLGMGGYFGNVKEKHSHLLFVNEESNFGFDCLYYTNVRFIGGYATFITDQKAYEEKINSLAEPIGLGDEIISLDEFKAGIKKCRKRLFATCLMDQKSICSGIGNWLLSETFYASKLNPYVKCSDLTDEQIELYYTETNRIIGEAYRAGGVSVRDFRDLTGTEGKYQHELKVYSNKRTDSLGNKVVPITGPHNRTFWYVAEMEGEISEKYKKKAYGEDYINISHIL